MKIALIFQSAIIQKIKGGIKFLWHKYKIDQLDCCRLLAIRYLISEINVPNITIFTFHREYYKDVPCLDENINLLTQKRITYE